MPTPVLVQSPAIQIVHHIHLLPSCGRTARPNLRERLHLQPRQPLLPQLVIPNEHTLHPSQQPQRYSLLTMALAASSAPMLWLLHAAGHAIHLY